jgi:TatA/E family protein of Tat protein translocase
LEKELTMGILTHWWEIVIVVGIALLVFGPRRFVDVSGALGKSIREFRHSIRDDEQK